MENSSSIKERALKLFHRLKSENGAITETELMVAFAESEKEWFNVSENLPPSEQQVLVCDEVSGKMWCARLQERFGHKRWNTDEPTSWMYLPKSNYQRKISAKKYK